MSQQFSHLTSPKNNRLADPTQKTPTFDHTVAPGHLPAPTSPTAYRAELTSVFSGAGPRYCFRLFLHAAAASRSIRCEGEMTCMCAGGAAGAVWWYLGGIGDVRGGGEWGGVIGPIHE